MSNYSVARLNLCPKCGMDSGVRVHIQKGAAEWALVRCRNEKCHAETKRYKFFPAAARAWNRGDVEVRHENEKSEKA